MASNNVWSDISNRLGGSISKSALYIFVQQGRHGIHEKLGIDVINKRLEYESNVHSVEPFVEFGNIINYNKYFKNKKNLNYYLS